MLMSTSADPCLVPFNPTLAQSNKAVPLSQIHRKSRLTPPIPPRFDPLQRFVRVAALLAKKTVRDVAVRVTWLASQAAAKKRKAEADAAPAGRKNPRKPAPPIFTGHRPPLNPRPPLLPAPAPATAPHVPPFLPAGQVHDAVERVACECSSRQKTVINRRAKK